MHSLPCTSIWPKLSCHGQRPSSASSFVRETDEKFPLTIALGLKFLVNVGGKLNDSILASQLDSLIVEAGMTSERPGIFSASMTCRQGPQAKERASPEAGAESTDHQASRPPFRNSA